MVFILTVSILSMDIWLIPAYYWLCEWAHHRTCAFRRIFNAYLYHRSLFLDQRRCWLRIEVLLLLYNKAVWYYRICTCVAPLNSLFVGPAALLALEISRDVIPCHRTNIDDSIILINAISVFLNMISKVLLLLTASCSSTKSLLVQQYQDINHLKLLDILTLLPSAPE